MGRDYFIMISPPEHVSQEIYRFKRIIKEKIGGYTSLGSRAHITFQVFLMDSNKERALMTMVNNLCSTVSPFQIGLEDIKFFPTSLKTIYVNLANKQECRAINKVLKHKLKDFHMHPYGNGSFTPHITLAARLEEEKFKKAWNTIYDKSFTQKFLADGLTILRRTPNNSSWKELSFLPFRHQQLNLFS